MKILKLLPLLLGLAYSTGASNVHTQVFLQAEAQVVKVENAKTPPVPTASRCIVILCTQYMLIYVALAVCRTYQEITNTEKGKVEESLRAAAQTMTYGPMLCCLFIACRMRVEFLSAGTDHPQIWVQRCMYGVTYAVLASTLIVLLIPLLTGKHVPLKESGDMEPVQADGEGGNVAVLALTIARYTILACLYVGLAGIIVGINIYLPPGATDLSKLPPPAPAVACTMIIAVVFFLTQLVIAFCRTYEEFHPAQSFPKLVAVMQEAATTVEFGPMLAILFLCARMRALQHDSQPQRWAQDCMYMATFAMCATTVLAIVIPFTCGGTMKRCPNTGEKTFVTPENSSKSLTITMNVLRYVCMIGFYGGAFGVIYSIYVFTAPDGQKTLPVSPAAHCVANLTCQFFFVYGMMTIMLTLSSLTGMRMEDSRLFSAIESAKATLTLAPMLAILFVTTRMYALLITQKKGQPQAWVQDGMYMATWSILISFVVCLGTGLAMDDKVSKDEDGNITHEFSSTYITTGLTVVRYLSMLLLYGGITLVIVGLFQMTPENANGRGRVPVVSDIVRASPFANRPPGAGGVIGPDGHTPPPTGSTGAQG